MIAEVKKKYVNITNMTLSELEEKGLMSELDAQGKRTRKKGSGRLVKVIDSRQQFSLSYWYELIVRDYGKLSRKDRTRIAVDCWKTLINKCNSIPADPNESKLNVDDALRALGKLEESNKPVSEPKVPVPA